MEDDNGMKKVEMIILMLILMLLVACGKIESEKGIQKYVATHYGKTEYLYKELKDDEHVTYYFKDEQCGLNYYVSSYMTSFMLDGTSFGKYEKKSTDFMAQYENWIKQEIGSELEKIASQKGLQLEWENTSDGFFNIICTGDVNDCIEGIEEIGNRTAEQDVKHLCKELYVVDEMGQFHGCYRYEEQRYITEAELEVDFYMEHVKTDYGINPEFLYMETKLISEVPGLDQYEQVMEVGDEYPKDNVHVYYFKYKGETHFICDVIVYRDYENSDARYLYSDLLDQIKDK